MESEREEGELTDEDLEEISDNTCDELRLLCMSSPSREPFKELSLTSVSDDSDDFFMDKNYYRQINHLSKRYKKHRKKRQYETVSKQAHSRNHTCSNKQRKLLRDSKPISISSSSDESSDVIRNESVLRQLRDAVRINRSTALPNCSLRTRLKRMIDGSSDSVDSDENLKALRDQALQSKQQSSNKSSSPKENNQNDKNDEDLIELRLLALKSAMIKKHANRQKRKEEIKKQSQENNNEKNVEEPIISEIQDQSQLLQLDNKIKENQSIEEDEDILRAMLLTSISKKIENKQTKNIPLSTKVPVPIHSPVNTNALVVAPVNTAPVNRFIINVNSDSSDSSSDDSVKEKTIVEQKNALNLIKNNDFSKRVSLFLKNAREASEKNEQKINSNNNNIISNNNNNNNGINDISHLPKSQQLEYRRLKRKLQILSANLNTAEKFRKLSHPSEYQKSTSLNIHKTNNLLQKNNKYASTIYNNNMEKVNDRLQDKGKYEELTPLMARVSEARIARDKTQTEVKRLINDLKHARIQLTNKHQEYTVLVRELVDAKTAIDKRLDDQKLDIKNKKKMLYTSTPNKSKVNEINSEPSSISSVESSQGQEVIISANDEQGQQANNCEDNNNPESSSPNDEPKTTSSEEIKKENALLHYSSPLDHIQNNREQLSNPLLELCPYDLLGVCRDADCSYLHYRKGKKD